MDMILDIPAVYQNHLCPLLPWNDLLRVRRLCKSGQKAVDDYFKSTLETFPRLYIDEGQKSLDNFLQLEIPYKIQKLLINNSETGTIFFDNQVASLETFLNKHSLEITHLKVNTLSVLPRGKEKEFLSRLENLRVLEVNNWIITDSPVADEKEQTRQYTEIYGNLVELKVCSTDSWNDPYSLCKIMSICTELANRKVCPKLKSFTVPFAPAHLADDPQFSYREFIYKLHESVVRVLHLDGQRHKGIVHPTLRKLRFEHFNGNRKKKAGEEQRWMEKLITRPFVAFLEDVSEIEGFTLEMVNATWFIDTKLPVNNNAGHCIRSLINILPNVMEFVSLDNLQCLEVMTSRSNVLHHSVGEFNRGQRNSARVIRLSERPTWEDLKSIKINIDSEELDECEGYMMVPDGYEFFAKYWAISISFLFKFLFKGVSMESLTELRINFEHVSQWTPGQHTVKEIVKCCPNITNLGLTNWTGKNKCLIMFWEGLPKLEEVSLKSCKTLGNSAFVGPDQENPVFLRLLNLKTLSLLELDEMPKISDTLFRLVINRLKLIKLEITSVMPINNISVEGIRSLLGGCFEVSIEKFSFRDWSLLDCSVEDFNNLEKEFRSYYMV